MLRKRTFRNIWCFLSAFCGIGYEFGFCQAIDSTKHRAALILITDQPTRPTTRDLLDGIQEATRDAIGLTLFVEFNGPTALENQDVIVERRRLLTKRYAGQRIELLVAVGDRVVAEAESLRADLFPSAKLLFLALSRNTAAGLRQGEGLLVDMSPLQSIQLVMMLKPDIPRLVVVSGTSTYDEMLRKSLADSLSVLSGKREVSYLAGLPLPELVAKAKEFPKGTLIALASQVADRSGRATSLPDQARELSRTGAIVVEGSDASLGHGSLGGDLTAYRLMGQELGRRIRRTLDTGAAPEGVVLDAAPRRLALDWRELKRLGISEGSVPPGFELAYRRPTLWEEHRSAILAVGGGLLLQTALIWFLLTERRRRAQTQARMQRQLQLEATVSKASADLSVVTREDLPDRLRDVSAGLSSCLGVERVAAWIYDLDEQDYVPIHWWPHFRPPVRHGAVAQQFPYLYKELLGGRTVSIEHLDELPPSAARDVAELQQQGFVSVVAIPLKLAEEPVGAFVLGTYTRTLRWDSEAISTLHVLADILGQGISRSLAEDRARGMEEQSRAMLASLPGFVLMVDGTGQILKQNSRLELAETELPGALAAAHPGRNLLELSRSDGEPARQLTQALEKVVLGQRTSLVMEYRYNAAQGARWMEVCAQRLWGKQTGAVISYTDITERKRIEEENAQNRQTAWHLNRVAALGELTASLAHEINQPLAAILNSAEAAAALLSRSSPDLPEAMEAIRDIIHDDKRAGAVIHKMRSMLKRRHEGVQPVDLNATVTDTLRLVMNEARLRHVHLRQVLSPDLPSVVADPTQLQQVILNLVTNGIEAVESMEQRVVEIQTSRSALDAMHALEVRDSGPGIPAEMLTAIFEPFYTTKRQGLGFGLSICRSIVDSLGGKITVENRTEGGAVFRVLLREFAVAPHAAEQINRAGAD